MYDLSKAIDIFVVGTEDEYLYRKCKGRSEVEPRIAIR